MLSLSLRISCRFFVPRMFLSVVCASNLTSKRRIWPTLQPLQDVTVLLPGGVVSILYVGHRHGGVGDPVVDDGVHRHRHGVFCQHLEARGRSITVLVQKREIVVSWLPARVLSFLATAAVVVRGGGSHIILSIFPIWFPLTAKEAWTFLQSEVGRDVVNFLSSAKQFWGSPRPRSRPTPTKWLNGYLTTWGQHMLCPLTSLTNVHECSIYDA